MAIVKMKKLRLLAVRSESEVLLRRLQKLGCVQVCDQTERLADPEVAALAHREDSELLKCRNELSDLQHGVDLLDKYAPVKTSLLAPKPLLSQSEFQDESEMEACLAAARRMDRWDDQIRRIQAEESRCRSVIESLLPWKSLELPVDTRGTVLCAAMLGTVPGGVLLDELERELAEVVPEAQVYELSSSREQRCLLVLCLRVMQTEALEMLRHKGFSAASFGTMTGTAADNIRETEKRLGELAEEKAGLEASIAELSGLRESLKRCADRVRTNVARAEVRERLLSTESTVVLEGWVTVPEIPAVESLLGEYDCAWELEEPKEEEYPEVPVKLHNNAFTNPLNMVTEMYSLPAYNGVDPNPLMAPFFILFYGMMMADMGYGILMILGGLLVSRKARPGGTMGYLFKLMISCGVSTFIWGALTGGFFGDAPVQVAKILNPETTWAGLPALFSPLDDALMVLIGSLALGVVQIFTGMGISFYMKARRGQLLDALCNEGAWFLVFVILGVTILMGQIKIGLIAVVVLLVLTQGYGKKGIVGKLMGIGGSLYNNITGYFSDILSYSRLMALMLAGAVIAQVFNTLGAITGNIITFLIIAAIGNALNLALNLLGCFVHDMRLQCLEFFGRFYKDGGKPFRPLAVNAKYVNVAKD